MISLSKMPQKTSVRLKHIAHPVKMKILSFIKEREPVHVIEIYKSLRLEQSICSSMLSDLRQSKLVFSKKEGRKVFYSVNYEAVEEIVSDLKAFFSK